MTDDGRRPRRPPRGNAWLKASQTECVRGHEFDDQNTYIYFDSDGRRHRWCKPCGLARKRKAYAAAKQNGRIQ
jgi:hypothetical protein